MLDTQIFSDYLLKAAVMLIMAGMGLSLTTKDFRKIFIKPKALLLGLVSQMVFLPLLALAINTIPGLTPEWKVGLFLVGICPGGATSNLLNFLLRGNLALSVSLATVNSFLTLFSIPFFLHSGMEFYLDSDTEIHLPFTQMVSEIFLLTLFPTLVGMLIRAKFPETSHKLRNVLKYLMPSLLAVSMVGAIFFEKKEVVIRTSDYLSAFPHTLLLNLLSMIAGYSLGRICRLDTPTAMTISLETGLQNTGLALAIALSSGMLNNPSMAVPAATYAMFTFFTSLIFGLIVNRKNVSLKDVFRKTKEISTTED